MRDEDETLEQLRDKRARLRAKFGTLYDSVAQVLYRHDPMDLVMEFNQDEYFPEADAILLRIEHAGSPAELRQIIWQVFKELFAPDEEIDENDAAELGDNVGEESKYDAIATDIWQAYARWHRSSAT